MNTIRMTAVAIGLAAMSAVALSAQKQETTTTTKNTVEIKGGKDLTVIGCLDRNTQGDYVLTKAGANRLVKPTQYALVSSEDLAKHVGERVEVQGKVVAGKNGKVTVESKTTTEVENGKDRETKAKTEGVVATEQPFFGVSSMKTLSKICN